MGRLHDIGHGFARDSKRIYKHRFPVSLTVPLMFCDDVLVSELHYPSSIFSIKTTQVTTTSHLLKKKPTAASGM